MIEMCEKMEAMQKQLQGKMFCIFSVSNIKRQFMNTALVANGVQSHHTQNSNPSERNTPATL